jgi:Zinc carboxypeptidase
MSAAPIDPARFFTTDAEQGALLDRNGDGVPDDLRARLAVVGEPSVEEWCELIHLAARLGLETGALSLPLGLSDGVTLPDGGKVLRFVAASAGDASGLADGWVVRSVAELRALWGAGLGSGGAALPATATAATGATLDLARLYDTDGLLRDDDGDLTPDRVALTIVLSRAPSMTVGLALCDLAARLGMESAGLRFPLAVPFGAPIPPGDVLLSIAPPIPGLGRPAPGEGLVAVTPDDQGRTALLVAGDDASAARLIRDLAATWPYPRAWDASGVPVADLLENLAATLHGEDAAGRAALLAADLAALDPANATGELRLLDDDPALRGAAEAAIGARGLTLTVEAAPEDTVAFVDEWTDEWEVDRARRIIRERVLPDLDLSQPADLLVLVGESLAIRQELAQEWAALLPVGSAVRVLSAFKAGFSWLREIVAPAWAQHGDVAAVELRYRPFAAPEGEKYLDLPIRWLQELYPADEILASALGIPVEAITLREAADQAATYAAVALDADGIPLDVQTFSPRSYGRPYLTNAPEEGFVTVTTGAIVARQGGRILCDETLPTDLDRFWGHYQGVVLPRVHALIAEETGGTPTADAQPFFAGLDIDVWCSEPNESLGLREELWSSAEALHEDLYFGTLDAIAVLGSAAPASGTLAAAGDGALDAPGAIRPFVHVAPGAAPRSRIVLRRRLRHLAELVSGEQRQPLGMLPGGSRPQLAVSWAVSRPDVPGFARLGVSLVDADARLVAALRHLAATATAGEDVSVAEITVPSEEAPIAVALPIGFSGLTTRAQAAELAEQPDSPVTPEQLPALLAALPAPAIVRRVGRSYEGREMPTVELVKAGGGAIWSRHKASVFKPTLLVIARHHANEPASTHAALRLAWLCGTDPGYAALLDRVNIAILPMANPDGAALHALMMAEHPTWKHHAARYNAVGREFARDHFDPATPWGEARVRPRLWREWLPDVVVDNHGVPSHEWNQLFDGFGSPPRFNVSYWLVSALIYGILRYPPEHAAISEALRDRIAAAVTADPDLHAGNTTHHALYNRWGYSRVPERFPAEYHREMLWYFGPQSPDARARSPRQPDAYYRVTAANLVTEVPDETAQGAYLHLVGHAHLVANRAILDLLAEAAPPVERTVSTDAAGTRVLLRRQRPLTVG